MNWTVVYLIFSVFCLSAPESVIRTASGQIIKAGIKVLDGGDDGQCPSVEERERARNEIHQIVSLVIATTTPTTTVLSTTTSATTTPAVTTMSTTAGVCGTPGWRRVAFIDMTDTNYDCPTGLSLTTYSKRTCGASHTTGRGCSSTIFSVGGSPYSRVCGRIRGYQVGSTDAFHNSAVGINGQYVAGVSLTHGAAGRQQHIWTFAAGISEATIGVFPNEACPCDTASPSVVPAFVGNDYFCESGLHSAWSGNFGVFFPDVLWDGQNCTSTSTCCQFNNPPWFTKNLPTATTNDIELRICTPNSLSNANVPLELIELYIQ